MNLLVSVIIPTNDRAALLCETLASVQAKTRPEASASGLPVVSTRHAGIPEAVIDGESGLLVDERDVSGMAERMRRVLDEPALASRLGRAGRDHVAEHYETSRQIGKLWAVIEEAMKGHGERAAS